MIFARKSSKLRKQVARHDVVHESRGYTPEILWGAEQDTCFKFYYYRASVPFERASDPRLKISFRGTRLSSNEYNFRWFFDGLNKYFLFFSLSDKLKRITNHSRGRIYYHWIYIFVSSRVKYLIFFLRCKLFKMAIINIFPVFFFSIILFLLLQHLIKYRN